MRAYQIQQENIWGAITLLAEEYEISRPFIYSLLSTFKELLENQFAPKEKPSSLSKEAIEAKILAYRFEGKSSIDGIYTLMKRDGLPFSSTGSISQILTRLGKSLSNTLENKGEPQLLVFADDEVFSKSSPILITVDPVSSAILSIELTEHRTADVWKDHLNNLVAHGFSPRLITSDGGIALKAAHNDIFADIPWQLDTFHGIAHRLGDWNRRLEKSVNTCIKNVEKRENTLASAKNEEIIDKRLNDCFKLDEKKSQAIDLYDDFNYLYQIIIHQLTTFDSTGELREKDQAEGEIEAALDLMASIDHKTINKEAILIKKTLPDLLIYFDDAPEAFARCQELTDNKEAIQALALAWQWNKAVIKSKVTDRKHHAIEQRNLHLQLAELFIGDKKQFIQLKKAVYAELDQIIQASSMVECINSILRPYLNASRNQVTQEFLNLFMFYHNHRRYHAGKRKGKTPMELLTGKTQKEDWITLLQKQAKETSLSV
jgi:hypothetical protein